MQRNTLSLSNLWAPGVVAVPSEKKVNRASSGTLTACEGEGPGIVHKHAPPLLLYISSIFVHVFFVFRRTSKNTPLSLFSGSLRFHMTREKCCIVVGSLGMAKMLHHNATDHLRSEDKTRPPERHLFAPHRLAHKTSVFCVGAGEQSCSSPRSVRTAVAMTSSIVSACLFNSIHEKNDAWIGKHVHLSGWQLGFVKITLSFCLVFMFFVSYHAPSTATRTINNDFLLLRRSPPNFLRIFYQASVNHACLVQYFIGTCTHPMNDLPRPTYTGQYKQNAEPWRGNRSTIYRQLCAAIVGSARRGIPLFLPHINYIQGYVYLTLWSNARRLQSTI